MGKEGIEHRSDGRWGGGGERMLLWDDKKQEVSCKSIIVTKLEALEVGS